MINRRHIIISAAIALAGSHAFAQATDQHGVKWETLMSLDGQYLQDKAAKSILTKPLKNLLGAKYQEFMESIKVQSPMEVENGLLIVQGMAPHSGGEYASLALFSMGGTSLGVLRKDKEYQYFGDKKILENPMAKDALANLKK